jgi:RHS repeat-associated protein
VTSYGYFQQGVLGAGRVASVTYADATVRRSAYDIRGNMTNEWGSATAPTSYGFDGYNQLETLSTYRTAITADSAIFPTTIGTPDVTTWVRQEATGLLTQKKYADNQGPVYLYDIAGRITRRTLARGSVTDYTYTAWGQPDVTNYADATPDADIDYDRMGRKTRESNGTATSTYQYSATTLRPTLETISYDLNRDGTAELIRQLDRSHDNLRRPTGFTLKDGTTTETATIYGYDAYSRLSQISNPQISNQIFNYSYLQNSNLLSSVTGPVHTVTNTWELDRDVLDAKENKVGSTVVSKLDYSVNAIGQRTALSQTGTAFASVRGIAWAYDSYGQVTSADSTLAAQDRAYQYDAIGNRKKSANSLTLPVADNYTANALNQYSSLSIPNPQSPISNPIYDPDGNATSYPLPAAPTVNSILTWDSENRMTSTTVNGTTTTQQFDATGRRISKTTGTTTRLYLYDAWNVIAEYERGTGVSPVLTLKKTYLWGTDLSGSIQGAGGVGGLLLITDHSALLTSHYPTYDGNGNISEYLTATGAIAAHFEYDCFGNTTINTDATNQFSYKFSTKPQDVETGLYYYGYRYYDARTGRWVNRDPTEEKGGKNLYVFLENNGVRAIDFLGMWIFSGARGERISSLSGAPPSRSRAALPAFGPTATIEDMWFQSLYKLANSALSTSLVDHYFRGGGLAFDLSAYLDILSTARNQVWIQIEDKYFEELRGKLRSFICPRVDKATKYTIKGPSGNGDRAINYTSNHSGIGMANMNMEYNYEAVVWCECKQQNGKAVMEGTAFLEGNYRYDFYDQFKDAADWGNIHSGGDREYTGGARFNIVGAWNILQTQTVKSLW